MAAACAYAVLAIRIMLRSEQIRPAGLHSDWSLVERVVAFPAFYLGVAPLTGLIINSIAWGALMAALFVMAWPRGKDQDGVGHSRD